MGMKVDTAKTRRALYGITMGMTNQELVEYSGYSIYTIRSIRKDPEKYKKALQEQAKKEDEQRRKREYVSFLMKKLKKRVDTPEPPYYNTKRSGRPDSESLFCCDLFLS